MGFAPGLFSVFLVFSPLVQGQEVTSAFTCQNEAGKKAYFDAFKQSKLFREGLASIESDVVGQLGYLDEKEAKHVRKFDVSLILKSRVTGCLL